METLLRGALAIGAFAVFGGFVLRAFPSERGAWWERAAAAYALGFGLLPFAMLLPALCGARLAGLALFAPIAAALLLAVGVRVRSRAGRARAATRAENRSATPSRERAPTHTTKPVSARSRILEIAAVAVLVAVGAIVVALGYALPLYKFDAWAQVGFKAKVFFETRALEGFFGRADLLHYQNADYPLLVPLAETWVAIVAGGRDEHLVKLPIALLYPALLALFYASAARHLSRGRALIATLALCAIFHFRFFATVGYADVPLAVFAFLAFDRLVARPAPSRADIVLGGIYAGLAAFAKNEGFVVIAALALVTLARPILAGAAIVRGGESRIASGEVGDAPGAASFAASARAAGACSIIALAMNAPWLVFRSARGLSTALLSDGAGLDFARVGPLLFAVVREATDWGRWNILWPVAAVAGAIALVRRASAPLAAFALALAMLLAYAAVLLASPFSLDFLVATALERLLVHIVPLAVYATMLTLLGDDARKKETAAP